MKNYDVIKFVGLQSSEVSSLDFGHCLIKAFAMDFWNNSIRMFDDWGIMTFSKFSDFNQKSLQSD